jgi:hypothetical protein
MPLQAPVVLILFNRPRVTERVFRAIAEARPSRLLLIADGPRNAAEKRLTDAARAAVECIDWPCEVERDYAEANLGCRRRVGSGLDWVFERCDEAIILEDDCLPHPSFFRFCDELLDRYHADARVAMISGDHFQPGPRGKASYYFSAIAHVWGWATWRRAWRGFDVTMSDWPADRHSDRLRRLLLDEQVLSVYRSAFDAVHAGRVDTWDAQWQHAVWRSGGLVALPNVNLVTNLGFGADATHTRKSDSPDANLPVEALAFPLIHPPAIERDVEADRHTWRRHFSTGTIAG